jgi:hypothetical protein
MPTFRTMPKPLTPHNYQKWKFDLEKNIEPKKYYTQCTYTLMRTKMPKKGTKKVEFTARKKVQKKVKVEFYAKKKKKK